MNFISMNIEKVDKLHNIIQNSNPLLYIDITKDFILIRMNRLSITAVARRRRKIF